MPQRRHYGTTYGTSDQSWSHMLCFPAKSLLMRSCWWHRQWLIVVMIGVFEESSSKQLTADQPVTWADHVVINSRYEFTWTGHHRHSNKWSSNMEWDSFILVGCNSREVHKSCQRCCRTFCGACDDFQSFHYQPGFFKMAAAAILDFSNFKFE